MRISEAVRSAEHRTRVAFAQADAAVAACASRYATLTTKGSTPAARIASAIGVLTQSPTEDHLAISTRLKSEVESAMGEIERVVAEALELAEAARYIKGESSRLDINDPGIAAAAATVREGHRAGLINAAEVSAAITRRLDEVLAEVARLEKRFIPQTRSAVTVASAGQMARLAKAAGLPNLEHFERRSVRVKALHNWRYGATPKARPAKKGAAR